MNLKIIYVLLLCFGANTLAGQASGTIRILDEGNNLPVIGATFLYGDQNGISDENGDIDFTLNEADTMRLSHVGYGNWSIAPAELKNAVEKGVYYRRSASIDLYPVTVIAMHNSTQQPEQKLNIDYEDRMEHDGAALLNQLPAFNSIRKSGNYGFDPVFRGYKYDQLNIVLNGAQCATAACPNRMDPPTSQMAPNMMDRVEVLKGPYALRYGTGLGATINFVQSKLRFTPDKDLYGRVSAGYEGNGNVLRGEGQIGFSGDRYDVSFFGSWSQGDDYTSGNGDLVRADFNRGSFGTQLGFRLFSNQQLRVSAMYNRARDADFPALPMDLRTDDTWMFNARHDIYFESGTLQSWNTTLFGSFVDHVMDNLLKPLDPRMLNASTNAKTSNYGGRTEGAWQFSRSRLYAGADLRVEGAEGIRTREFLLGPNAGKTVMDNAWQDGRIHKVGAFGEYHLNTPSIQYVFAGRLELNMSEVQDPEAEFLEVNPETEATQFNPSLSVGIRKNWNETFSSGVWLGRAQRSGSLTERFINYFPVGQDPFEMLGNPQLDPEVNNQLDLTFEWKSKGTAINVDLFVSYLQDYISSLIDTSLGPRLPMSPGVRQYINIDQAVKTGFEISWTQNLPLGLQHQLGLAYTYAQDLERDEPLPEIPPFDLRYNLIGNYFNGRLAPEVMFRYMAEQSRISPEFGETVTPDFALLDIKVAYNFTDKISLAVGVNNIFDRNYYEHLNRSVRGTNAPIFARGRNMFANLSVRF